MRSHIHLLHKESANVSPRMFFLFGSGATRIHIHSLLLAGLLCHEQQAADHIIVIPLISSCTFYVELCGEYACFSNHGTRCCDLAAKTHHGHGSSAAPGTENRRRAAKTYHVVSIKKSIQMGNPPHKQKPQREHRSYHPRDCNHHGVKITSSSPRLEPRLPPRSTNPAG